MAPRGLGRLGKQPAAAALSQLRCATTSQRLCPCGTHAAAHGVGGQWALDSRLSVLVFGIDLLMTITGLSLWALLYMNPFLRDSWLLALREAAGA